MDILYAPLVYICIYIYIIYHHISDVYINIHTFNEIPIEIEIPQCTMFSGITTPLLLLLLLVLVLVVVVVVSDVNLLLTQVK